jgi:hypothetical protein
VLSLPLLLLPLLLLLLALPLLLLLLALLFCGRSERAVGGRPPEPPRAPPAAGEVARQ